MHDFWTRIRRGLLGTLICLSLTQCGASLTAANGWPKTLVKSNDAAVYLQADATSQVLVRLRAGEAVGVAEEREGWRRVFTSDGRQQGWMKAADLVTSEGMARFWEREYADAVRILAREIRAATAPVVSSWLEFYLGYSQWATGHLDEALACFEAVALRQPPVAFGPLAYIVTAKVNYLRGDLAAALRAYDRLLAAFPGYELTRECVASAVNPYPNEWPESAEICSGEPAITSRVSALRTLMALQATTDRVLADPSAKAEEKARAWYELGRGWEEKNRVDPGKTHLGGMLVDNTEAIRCYEAAVKRAPATSPAGFAAFRLIPLSEPYEWEGDWQGRAEWMLSKYGAFLSAYPRHELAGEAMFKLAQATWAQGGYPEVFGYIITPDGWGAWKARQTDLAQGFDTRGFGGGRGATAKQEPGQAARALRIFRDLLARYPSTQSAGMAKYYSAVILDYCLGEQPKALAEYEAFVRRYPQMQPFVDKANRRIAVLRRGK